MQVILADHSESKALQPFTFLRPVSEIRVGILTITQKWERFLGCNVSFKTEPYLAEKYPLQAGDDNLIINGAVLPSGELVKQLSMLNQGEQLVYNQHFIACRINGNQLKNNLDLLTLKEKQFEPTRDYPLILNNIWDIFLFNDTAIRSDFEMLTKNRHSQTPADHVRLINPGQVFIEEGAVLTACVINASTGPVYISKESEIMEGSLIRGPFALLPQSKVKMGAKIYGATTIGPMCNVGGEINNSVFFGFSNKAHDGYIGNSVIGHWCNLGADTNCSNLKNNYSKVKVWSFARKYMIDTNQQFCGLFMGDHTKCSINTMFNTGTVTGVCANIFGGDFPPKFIPSFSWGGSRGFDVFQLQKAVELARIVAARRQCEFTSHDENIFSYLFHHRND